MESMYYGKVKKRIVDSHPEHIHSTDASLYQDEHLTINKDLVMYKHPLPQVLTGNMIQGPRYEIFFKGTLVPLTCRDAEELYNLAYEKCYNTKAKRDAKILEEL